MTTSRIRLSIENILRQLDERQMDFSPFELSLVQLGSGANAKCTYDALIDLTWAGSIFRFIVESKTRFDSLQTVQTAIEQARQYAKSTKSYPMIYLPYLSPNTVKMLKEAAVSGFDLCGNLFVSIPGKVYVERVGKRNLFPSSAPIKNIYQKNSSLVSRLFLLQPSFESITAIVHELKRRNGDLTQATVSKVCRRLEEDIIIGKKDTRKQKETYLIQPKTLLEYLSEQYAPPTIRKRLMVKLRIPPKVLPGRLIGWSRTTGENIVQTGTVSCIAYTVMARDETTAFYCSHVARLLSDLEGVFEETKRFTDIELIETDDQFVYFDQRNNLYASPIQSYLELMQGDKRDQQAAKMIATELLKKARTSLEKNEN